MSFLPAGVEKVLKVLPFYLEMGFPAEFFKTDCLHLWFFGGLFSREFGS